MLVEHTCWGAFRFSNPTFLSEGVNNVSKEKVLLSGGEDRGVTEFGLDLKKR